MMAPRRSGSSHRSPARSASTATARASPRRAPCAPACSATTRLRSCPCCGAGHPTGSSPTRGGRRCGASRPGTGWTPPTSSVRSGRWVRSVAEAVALTVRYFAAAAEAAGREEEGLEVEPTAGPPRSVLAERYGSTMRRVLEGGSLLVDGVVTRDPDRPLGPSVDVLPPFAGG